MKEKIIKLAGICLMAALVFAFSSSISAKKVKDGDQPKIYFEETTYNFGTIKEQGGQVSHEFEFVNTGNGKLVIISARAECGCTRPEYPQKPIAPGKKGKIKVTYNPVGRPGAFTKGVTIKTNGQPAKIRLKIKGTVVPGK